MRRILMALLLCAVVSAWLAGCGNKGPLVRAPAQPAGTGSVPAPAASSHAATPSAPASAPVSTSPEYLSPPIPATSTGFNP